MRYPEGCIGSRAICIYNRKRQHERKCDDQDGQAFNSDIALMFVMIGLPPSALVRRECAVGANRGAARSA